VSYRPFKKVDKMKGWESFEEERLSRKTGERGSGKIDTNHKGVV